MNLQFRCIECGTIVGFDGIRTDGVRCPICKGMVNPERCTLLPSDTPRISIKPGVSGTPLVKAEKKTLLTVDIKTSDLPEVKEFIEKANERISNQQRLLESYARIVDGMISDAIDIRERLINVLDDLEVANTTIRLEEHDEALRDAIKSVAYLIDFLSNIEEEED